MDVALHVDQASLTNIKASPRDATEAVLPHALNWSKNSKIEMNIICLLYCVDGTYYTGGWFAILCIWCSLPAHNRTIHTNLKTCLREISILNRTNYNRTIHLTLEWLAESTYSCTWQLPLHYQWEYSSEPSQHLFHSPYSQQVSTLRQFHACRLCLVQLDPCKHGLHIFSSDPKHLVQFH